MKLGPESLTTSGHPVSSLWSVLTTICVADNVFVSCNLIMFFITVDIKPRRRLQILAALLDWLWTSHSHRCLVGIAEKIATYWLSKSLSPRSSCLYLFFVSHAVFKAVTFLLPFKKSPLLAACVMNELPYESFIVWRGVSSVFFYLSLIVRDLLQERKQESSRFVTNTSKINSPLPEPLPGLPQCLPLTVHLLLVIRAWGHHLCDLWWEQNSSRAPLQERVWLFNEVFAIAFW